MRYLLSAMLVMALCCVGCNKRDDAEPAKPAAPTAPATPTVVVKQISPEVITLCQAMTTSGSLFGLQEWAKKDPNAAKECATNLSSNITQQLLPYLQGQGQLKSSAEIQQLLQTSVFSKVPEQVKIAIVAASAVLDMYVPIPPSQQFMNADQVKLVSAFLTGMRDACDQFTKPTTRAIAEKKWVQ